jgi:hypothetical protein
MRVVLAAAILYAVSFPVLTSETTAYTYDALGRLSGSLTTGSVNNNMITASTHDAVGNRTQYSVDPTGNTTVALTDGSLNVLSAHASIYSCSTTVVPPPFSVTVRSCKVISTNYTVYQQVDAGAPTFDPGYSMTTNYVLLVTQTAYGTSVSP